MRNIDFDEWLVDFYTFSKITYDRGEELYPLQKVVNMLMEYDEYLSIGYKRFIYWFFTHRDYRKYPFSGVWGLFWLNKFFEQYKNSSSITMFNHYKHKIDSFISLHCKTDLEKAICIKIILTSIWIDIENFEQGVYVKLNKDYCIKKHSEIENFFRQITIYYDLKFRKYNKNNRLTIVNKGIDDWLIINEDYKEEQETLTETSSKENPAPQQITPIKLELNQTQIVYLFQQLVEKEYLRPNKNPALWNLISQYFVDVNDKPLKNIHQVKDRLINNREGKPKREADTIDEIVSFLDTFKD